MGQQSLEKTPGSSLQGMVLDAESALESEKNEQWVVGFPETTKAVFQR